MHPEDPHGYPMLNLHWQAPAIYNPALSCPRTGSAIHGYPWNGHCLLQACANTPRHPRDMTPPPLVHNSPGLDIPATAWSLLHVSGMILACALLTACQPDHTPLVEENERLNKQVAKQETMMVTIQDGNRVLQEQIDRLNRELRDNEEAFVQRLERAHQTEQGLSTKNHNLLQQIGTLTKDNRSLTLESQRLKAENTKHKGDARWLRKQREIIQQSLQTSLPMVEAQRLPHPLRDVTQATSQALAQHGYAVLARMATDKKAVFVTERKTLPAPSIELPGYRNQYVVELAAQPNKQTDITVMAQYETVEPGKKIPDVDDKDVSVIEHRFIQAILHILDPPPSQARPDALDK